MITQDADRPSQVVQCGRPVVERGSREEPKSWPAAAGRAGSCPSPASPACLTSRDQNARLGFLDVLCSRPVSDSDRALVGRYVEPAGDALQARLSGFGGAKGLECAPTRTLITNIGHIDGL